MTDSDDILAELSALMDGELPPDRSAFLLRRLENEPALRGAWERWQLASTCLRQGVVALSAPGFAAGVAARVADEASPHRSIAGTLVRWIGGGAIAAAVAVFALVAVAPEAPTPGASTPAIAQAPVQIAPSPLLESDLQPRFQAPAETVAVNQRLPVLSVPAARGGLDPQAQAYLMRHQTALREAGLIQFAPYVDVLAHADQRGLRYPVEEIPGEDGR